MNKKIFFSSGSGRSGTTSLANFFRDNVADCIAEHEAAPAEPRNKAEKLFQILTGSFMDPFEDKGFRKALRWYDEDDFHLEKVIARRVERIRKMPCSVYLEANHSFLQSLCDGLVRALPDLQVIHLTRNPLEVARSFANRPTNYEEWHVLPDFKKNCLPMGSFPMTRFQRFLWAWIEIELRFVRFIERYPQIRFYELEMCQINSETEMRKMLEFFELPLRAGGIRIGAKINKNMEPTCLSPNDHLEAQALLRNIPLKHLKSMRRPYDLLEIRDG